MNNLIIGQMCPLVNRLSTGVEMLEQPPDKEPIAQKLRVLCVVDGFNLYHSLDWFEGGITKADCERYRKYRWLSLHSLAKCYIRPKSEELIGVRYFTTYAHWDEGKVFRHKIYVRAQEVEGTTVKFGLFKNKQVECKAECGRFFSTWEEKRTDVNIARCIIEAAYLDEFDRLILISGDSDQIPALEFIKENMPKKHLTVVIPIGRSAEELKLTAHTTQKMTEDHLKRSQLPEKLKVQSGEWVQKPQSW
jgi:uncharacterized LabA/DUF88 family protein